MLQKFAGLVFAYALLGISSLVSAAVIYDESVNGDAPGVLPGAALDSLVVGTSTVVGTTPGIIDDDWYSFTIGVGMQLDGIILAAFTSTLPTGGNGGWAIGNAVQDDPEGPVTVAQIGSDLLTAINWVAAPPAALGPGTYGFKLGTGSNINTYSLDFVVSATQTVPEPATLALLAFGLAGLGFSRRKKS